MKTIIGDNNTPIIDLICIESVMKRLKDGSSITSTTNLSRFNWQYGVKLMLYRQRNTWNMYTTINPYPKSPICIVRNPPNDKNEIYYLFHVVDSEIITQIKIEYCLN